MTDPVPVNKTPQSVPMPSWQEPVLDGKRFAKAWYVLLETMRIRSGGDGDKANTALTGLDAKVDATTEIFAGNGLTGGGPLTGNVTLNARKDTGWTASTGAAAKGAYAVYPGQTVGAGYVQAQAQATDDGIKVLAQRVKALEDALRANQSIDG